MYVHFYEDSDKTLAWDLQGIQYDLQTMQIIQNITSQNAVQ